jgi:hypothetical protein
VYFRDSNGQMRLLPVAWTSLNPEDPAILFGEGRSPFRIQDLLELARLVDALRSAHETQAEHKSSPSEGDHV